MASESILAGIANPPGTDIPERLSDLQTARSARTAQNLQNAQTQVDMIGRSAQSLLDSYYPEGSEQPTNPTQAAREYFRTRKQLIGMGVPKNSIPEKVPTRSQLEQARDQALTVKEQMEVNQPERLAKADLVQVNIDGKNVWVPADVATGLPTAQDQPEAKPVKTFTAFAPSLSEEFPEGFTAIRTPRGVMRQAVDEQGNISFVPAPSDVTEREITGSAEDVGMTPKTKGALEEELLKSDRALQRLERIDRAFRPEYQQTWTRLGFAWDAAKDKAGVDLTPQEQEELGDFSEFKQEAINNINLYIKEITGAQMSEAEADRLRLGVPDPGEGVFDGDSPTKFQSKMENSVDFARAVKRRTQFALENGLMDELESKSKQEGEIGGRLDIDNFLQEEESDVDKIIDEALGR